MQKKNYYNRYFNLYNSNMNKTWPMLNKSIKINKKSEFLVEFRIDERYITDNKVIANAFNIYFYNIGRDMTQHKISPDK